MHTDDIIGKLVADLDPVTPLHRRSGLVRMLIGLAISTFIVIYGFGVRADIVAGQPDPVFLTSAGLFLILALASSWSAVDMARPSVGIRRDGWAWTAMMAAVLPLAALALIALDLFRGHPVYVDSSGYECLAEGCTAGLLTLGVLVFWLRRGAPSSLTKAGLLVGVAAGSAGIFAVSLCCPVNSLIHIGLWHGGAVIVMGLLGRVFLPRVLAW